MHAFVGDVKSGAVAMPLTGEVLTWGAANGLRMDASAIATSNDPIFKN
jgi:hypothetical protein